MMPYLQVKQGITVKLVKNSDLEQNGTEESQPAKEFTIFPVFNVSLQVLAAQVGQGGPLQLGYAFDHVEYGILSALIPPASQAQIENVLSGYQLAPTTVDLSPLSRLINRPVNVINAGITCDSNGDFVAMRVEIRADGDFGPDFFTQNRRNLLNAGDWALLADARIFTEEGTQKIKTGLENVSKFRLKRGPSVSWDPSGPALNINLGGEAVDACPFFVDDIDMDVDAEIRTVLSVPQANILKTHYNFEVSASNVAEEVACAVTAALLWPFIGLVMFDKDQIDFPKYFAGLFATPLLRFVALIFAIETQGLSQDISRNLGSNCKKLDDENYECEDELDLTLAGIGGRLELGKIQGHPEGPVLGGNVINLRDYNVGKITGVNLAPFKWQIVGTCNSGFSIGNQASIFIGVEPPAALCSARILDDPLGEFALTLGDNELTITPRFKPEYVGNPYPCRIRLITTRGVRTLYMAPPQAQTAQETENLETARLRAIASCYSWEKHFTPKEKIQWLIDPPAGLNNYLQLWQIDMSKLRPEDQIRVEDQTGKTIMSARPSEAGTANLTLLFGANDGHSELALELDGVLDPDQESRKIGVKQKLYVHQASVPAPADLQQLAFEKEGDRNLLVYSSPEEAHKIDVTIPSGPTLQEIVSEKKGIKSKSLTRLSQERKELTPLLKQKVESLGISDSRLKNLRVVGTPKLRELRETLYLGLEKGGALYDFSNPENPREIQTYENRPWFEGMALSGKVLARHAPEKQSIEIFKEVASRII